MAFSSYFLIVLVKKSTLNSCVFESRKLSCFSVWYIINLVISSSDFIIVLYILVLATLSSSDSAVYLPPNIVSSKEFIALLSIILDIVSTPNDSLALSDINCFIADSNLSPRICFTLSYSLLLLFDILLNMLSINSSIGYGIFFDSSIYGDVSIVWLV